MDTAENAFDGPYIKKDAKLLYVVADCPPLGSKRLAISTEAFSVVPTFGAPRADGMVPAVFSVEVDEEVARDSSAEVEPLGFVWREIWPALYQALIDCRAAYGRTVQPTNSNASLLIEAPGEHDGYETEHWRCFLELEPDDGGFEVCFELDGSVIDTHAIF